MPRFERWSAAAVLLIAMVHPVFGAERLDASTAKPDEKGQVLFYDVRPLGVEGQGWTATKAPFDRLPAKAEGVARPVIWSLSHDSAGLCVRFVTDARAIS